MIKIYDGKFDKRFTSELASKLIENPWSATNVANRYSWPYRETGSHRLLGQIYFNNGIVNSKINDEKLTQTLIEAFKHIQNISKKEMQLVEICSNLQFKGMDGTLHKDGTEDQYAFILMLCNEEVENIGGEFIHIKRKIPFKHGRLIQITASDVHKALSFTKPHIARLSVKWVGKFK
tara:strand:- start:412 stop:942 length:531 start_codon:yes stop_codon:yes gene_type:complete